MKKITLHTLAIISMLIAPSIAFSMGAGGNPQLHTTQQPQPAQLPLETSLKNRAALATTNQLLQDATLDAFRDNPHSFVQQVSNTLPADCIRPIIEQLNRLQPGVLYGGTLEKTRRRPNGWPVNQSITQIGNRIMSISGAGTDMAQIWALNAATKSWEAGDTLIGHTGLVHSAAFNQTGNRIVTASADGTAKAWTLNPATNHWELEDTLNGHTSAVYCAMFNQNGDHIVTASWDNTAKVWVFNPATKHWELEDTLNGHASRIYWAAFNHTGNRIVTASSDCTAKVWTLKPTTNHWELEDTLTGHGHTSIVNSALFNHTGDRIVTASDHTAKIWILNPTTNRWNLEDTLTDPTKWFHFATFNQAGDRVDDSIIATAQDSDATIWHYGWLIDNTNLEQAMICLLAQREHTLNLRLNLTWHPHLNSIYGQLPPIMQNRLEKQHSVIPLDPWDNPWIARGFFLAAGATFVYAILRS